MLNNENQESSIISNDNITSGIINDSRSSSQQLNQSTNNINQPLINNNINNFQNIQIPLNNIDSMYPPQRSFNIPRPFSNNERNRYIVGQNYNNQNNNGTYNNSQMNYQVQLPQQYNNNISGNLHKFNRTFFLRNFGISCGTFIVCFFFASALFYLVFRANYYI